MTKITITALLVYISSFLSSQDFRVYEQLEKKSENYLRYFEVPDKGVLVEISTVAKKGGRVVFNESYKFYDKELQNSWTLEKLYSIEMLKRRYLENQKNISENERTLSIDPSGRYCLIYEQVTATFYRINIEDGTVLSQTANSSRYENGAKLASYIDEGYCYVIQSDYTLGRKKSKQFELIRVDIDQMNIEKFDLETPYVGDIRGLATRLWEPLGVRNNILYFKDNYGIQLKEDKSYYKRIILLNLENELVDDQYLFFGDRPVNDDFVGEVFFNKFNNGMLYTYSWSKNDKEKTILCAGYDSKLNKMWAKEYPSHIMGGLKLGISDVEALKIRDEVFMTHFYGHTEFIFKVNTDNSAFDFKIIDLSTAESSKQKKYTMHNFQFDILCEYPAIKEYITLDGKEKPEKIVMKPIFMDDLIIISKQAFSVYPDADEFIELVAFKI
ncbi:MAG: hypothetical protein KDC05_14020 [Bacteroidales bacterium]|nr:hypothetical protein [Bacteroidales bacterium]